jgi:hypothetical protein
VRKETQPEAAESIVMDELDDVVDASGAFMYKPNN